MCLPCCAENVAAGVGSRLSATEVHVCGREQRDAAVVVLVVVPREESTAMNASMLDVREMRRKVRAVLERLELRLAEGVVVGDVGPREALGHAEIAIQLRDGLRRHRRSAIGVNRQLRRIDALANDRFFDHLARQRRAFSVLQTPRHDVTAVDVQNDIEVVVGPLCGTEQLRDVPGPHLARLRCEKLGLDRCRMGRLSPTFARFAGGPQNAVPRRDRRDVDAFVEQRRVDLAHAAIAKAFAVRVIQDGASLEIAQSTRYVLRFAARCCVRHRIDLGLAMSLQRRTRRAQQHARGAFADALCQRVHDDFDRSWSVSLSPAIICKSACAFPSASIVRSAFAKRRSSRSFSFRKRTLSTVSGLPGRPRFRGGDFFASWPRQFAISELYRPSRRMRAARSNDVAADSYSARMRAFSSAVKLRRCLTERTSGSDATGNFLTRPHEFYFYDLASPIIDTEGGAGLNIDITCAF